jgi:virulence factor Mce-like protein
MDTKRLKLELQRSVKPLILFGILIACGIVSAGIIFHNQTFQRPWVDYYTVHATFDNVKGVTPPTQQVRIAGVKVGVVKDSKLVDGRPELTLSIEAKYGRLYKDARMRLRPSTPLQDMYVSIDRGTPAAGELSESQVVQADQTQSPVDISRVMNTFNTPTRERLASLLDALGSGLDDRGQSLRQAFANAVPFLDMAKRATQIVDRRKVAMRRVITNFGELTGVLADRNKQLTSVVSNGEATLGTLARSDRNLAATVRELGPTLTTMRSTFANVPAMEG